MAKQFKPGGPTSGKAKQINVQDLIDHIEETVIPSIKKNFQITEDAEFEVIKSELHNPDKKFPKSDQQIKQEAFEKTLAEANKFPVYVGMDFGSKGGISELFIFKNGE